MSEPRCDVCGGSDPPRTPYWRDNQNRTCDPCEARIQQHVEIALAGRAVQDGLDPERLRAALAEIAEGTEPDRIGRYDLLRDWVHKTATNALRAAPPLHDPAANDRG